MKIVIGLEFHGGAFCGWQSQPCGGGAQDAAEAALSRVANAPIRVFAAGRTDAGVHATLMPAHFVCERRRQPSEWVRGANAHLPPAMRALWAKPARDDFHARHRAIARHYQYILQNRDGKPGLLHGAAGHCHVPLDLPAMRLAARHLRGQHDFSAFRAAACQAKTPVRTLHKLRICRRGEFVIFHFCGNGFLHHMARNIVGALVAVGRGRKPPTWTRDLLAAKNRALAAPTAPAAGLYFMGAQYSPIYNLPPTIIIPPLGVNITI